MLALILALVPLLDLDPAAAAPASPTHEGLAAPAELAALPKDLAGIAGAPDACSGPATADGYRAVGKLADPPTLVVRAQDGDLEGRGGRVGGCHPSAAYGLERLSFPDLRALGPVQESAQAPPMEPLGDLVTVRCTTHETLRAVASLAFLGGALQGFALDIAPSHSLVTARLIDARKTPATVYLLGKIGVRTLEWCDRTDIADGHCPNASHGQIEQVALSGDYLVLTLTIGFADVCGQDDLTFKTFPLPPAVRRLVH